MKFLIYREIETNYGKGIEYFSGAEIQALSLPKYRTQERSTSPGSREREISEVGSQIESEGEDLFTPDIRKRVQTTPL